MTIIDSSGWLEYFTGGPNSDFFSNAIKNNPEIIIPTIILYELRKKIAREKGEDKNRFIYAAKISSEYKLPMADSIIYATVKKYNATLWTQDSDFKDLQNVRLKGKPSWI